VLDLTVGETTRLTALLALGGLLGFGYASYALGRGGDAYRMAGLGALAGLPAFGLVIAAAPLEMPMLFPIGNFLVGFGGALFAHGTLTATMSQAPRGQAGLALGAWGAVQATAAGIAVAASGILRDVVNAAFGAVEGIHGLAGEAIGYVTVYALEIALLLVTLVAVIPLIRGRAHARGPSPRAFEPAPPASAPAAPRSGATS
jgi:BCD family chlorophyll transporter-like MFS transporter